MMLYCVQKKNNGFNFSDSHGVDLIKKLLLNIDVAPKFLQFERS